LDKRQFLKKSGAIAAGALVSQFSPGVAQSEQAEHLTNWAGNLEYHAEHRFKPATVPEMEQIVKDCPTLRVLGSRHSFNTIADSTTNQITLENLTARGLNSAPDFRARTVIVGGGVRYGTLAPWLDAHGFAVHNLASLPHITVAGAISTGTHGSGVQNGNLSTAVAGFEFITADGQLLFIARGTEDATFDGCVVALGALGVITRIKLNVVPRFLMKQVVYQNLSMDQLEHNLEAIMSAGYSVSLFTDWQNHRINQVWIKSKVKAGPPEPIAPEFYGAKAATKNLHPLEGHSAENCTEQMGVPGPWYERLPHFRMNFTPSSGAELQTEYFVPRERGYEAILAVEKLKDKITPHLFVTELRTIAADQLWMSPAYKRDSLAIHFTWKPETPQVMALLPLIEEKLAPFDARPHWAKLFTTPPARLSALYEKMPDFQALLNQHDPKGKFRNQFIRHNIFNA